MDTISSRENNNIMPMVGVIVGALALLLAIYPIVKLTSVNKTLAEQSEKIAKIDQVEATATSAQSAADKANTDIRKLQTQTQEAINTVGTMIGETNAKVAKLEEARKAPVVAPGAKGAKGAEAGPGPGEYKVKQGEGGSAIARKLGVSLSALQAANPSVNWNKMQPGQILKVPAKK